MKEFLELYGKEMEFCQIQMNYLDWTLQNAKAKYELLAEYEIPVWIMEPVRGGRLAKLDEASEAKMKEMRPEESVAAWCFRYLQGFDKIGMILSGMSDMDQMKDNVKTFAEEKPLTAEEQQFLAEISEGMKKAVPCTACRYCVEGCPMGLDIPMLLAIYNDLTFTPSTNVSMRIEALPEHKKPSVCVGCGKCTRICPQKIDIPQAMKDFEVELGKLPSWEDVSREREEAQKKNAEKYAE
jgi:predicted aldo/keto reductase-like oxidoreductase